MIDQTTLGHRFLNEEFGYRPTVGWQIDPFGHSNTHAWLSSAVGFDGLFFGRIDYQDRSQRFKDKSMEMIWKGSNSCPDEMVFTGVFSDGNYQAPPGLCFDTTCPYCQNDPVIDDPSLSTYNLDRKVNDLIAFIEAERLITRGNNIMLKLGADFVYDNAHSWFKSMDKLMKKVNKDKRFNIFYSDPTTYMHAKAAEMNVIWPEKVDDFFPYSDQMHVSLV